MHSIITYYNIKSAACTASGASLLTIFKNYAKLITKLENNNGASGWDLFWRTLLGIICGGLIGAAIGAAVGAAAPAISAAASAVNGFLSSSFVVGSYVTASGAAVAVTVTGAQIVAGAVAAIALTGYLFARIGNSGGYRIDHHYPNDHDPFHVHISGDDGMTRVDLDGNPIQGDRPMTVGERKAFYRLFEQILNALKPWMK